MSRQSRCLWRQWMWCPLSNIAAAAAGKRSKTMATLPGQRRRPQPVTGGAGQPRCAVAAKCAQEAGARCHPAAECAQEAGGWLAAWSAMTTLTHHGGASDGRGVQVAAAGTQRHRRPGARRRPAVACAQEASRMVRGAQRRPQPVTRGVGRPRRAHKRLGARRRLSAACMQEAGGGGWPAA